jgi:hypothetical protein
MTTLVLIVAFCALALIAREFLRDRGMPSGSVSRTPSRPIPRQPGPRFNKGRLIQPEPVTRRARSFTPSPSRSLLQNGVKVAAVKNGRAVIPDNAIGLACLRPIAECSLGDRCVCLGQQELRTGNRL